MWFDPLDQYPWFSMFSLNLKNPFMRPSVSMIFLTKFLCGQPQPLPRFQVSASMCRPNKQSELLAVATPFVMTVGTKFMSRDTRKKRNFTATGQRVLDEYENRGLGGLRLLRKTTPLSEYNFMMTNCFGMYYSCRPIEIH